ncbi:hypothetical protein C8R44DRAFT_984847 [Mycena epipterygia]|nr:hypothetical protein C8R44DRAFT_984847 [Mycena epipterygia]
MSRIVIDEPLMLVAAARWLSSNPVGYSRSEDDLPRDSLEILQLYVPPSYTFLTSLVIYLTHAFAQGYPISKVFSFPHSNIPECTKQKADIVAFHQRDGRAVQYTVAEDALTLAVTRGVASLNTSLFKTLATTIPVTTILKKMVDAITLGKRKRCSEEL